MEGRRLEKQLAEDTKKPVNYHIETIKSIGSGFLEGMFAIPSFLMKIDDAPLSYTVPGLVGVSSSIFGFGVYTFTGQMEEAINRGDYTLPITTGVLLVTNLISGYKEAYNHMKGKSETDSHHNS